MLRRSAHGTIAMRGKHETPERAVTLVTADEERYLTQAYEEWVRDQAARSCYPELLFAPLIGGADSIYSRRREASGLVVRVVQQNTLMPKQLQQLAEFRFHQYVLWRWFDTKSVITHAIQTDPALDSLPPTTLHAFIGTTTGKILGYFVIEPAALAPPEQSLWRRLVHGFTPTTYRLGQLSRPLFPAEWESFGPAVFASIPALQQTPLRHVRELNCLMRNQAIPDALTALAAAEAVYTICQILIMPDLELHALLGCINQEARAFLAKLGIPMLYAADAPVLRNNLPDYWSADMNGAGKFWPFVVSVPDFLAHPDFLFHLDDVLNCAPTQMPRALAQYRSEGHGIIPTTVVPAWSPAPYSWSTDPFKRPSEMVTANMVADSEAIDLAKLAHNGHQSITVPMLTRAGHSG